MTHVQPILSRPPERKQEKHGKDETCDLARVGIESTGDQAGADERRAEIARGERDPGYTTRHARLASFVGCITPSMSARRFSVEKSARY